MKDIVSNCFLCEEHSLHVVGVELDFIDIGMQLCGDIKKVTKEYIALKNIFIPLDVIKG